MPHRYRLCTHTTGYLYGWYLPSLVRAHLSLLHYMLTLGSLIDFFAMRYISRKNAGTLPTTSKISTPPPAAKSACLPHGSPPSETEHPIRELDVFTHDHHSHVAHEVTDYSSDQAHSDVVLLEAGIIFQ